MLGLASAGRGKGSLTPAMGVESALLQVTCKRVRLHLLSEDKWREDELKGVQLLASNPGFFTYQAHLRGFYFYGLFY